jgi:hypothetical protein
MVEGERLKSRLVFSRLTVHSPWFCIQICYLINLHSKLEKVRIKDLVKGRNACLRQTNGLVGQTGEFERARMHRCTVITREDRGHVEFLVKCWDCEGLQDLESMTIRMNLRHRQRRAENRKKKKSHCQPQ